MWLSTTMATLVDAHQVPGAQLAVHRGDVTVAVEVGAAEHAVGTPITQGTAFAIGSITKSWTATLAMILVADGDLDLDEPLDRHLPELRHLGYALTLSHLLSHTSGFASSPDAAQLGTLSPRRYVREHCRAQDLILPPGTGFSYSSRNYVLAGHLIEMITGMSWAEAMESILLQPLGVEPAAGRLAATGHSVNPTLGRTRPVQQSLAAVEAPAGALAMSAVDLVALGRMHIGPGVPELLPAAYAEWMRQAVPAADPFGLADGWGAGLAVYRAGATDRVGATDWVGHDGNADGTSCYLRIDPAGGWVVALTTNANTGSALWAKLCTELRQASLPLGSAPHGTPLPEPLSAPAECAGSYANGPAEYHVTAADGGGLYLAVGDELTARLAFSHGLEFVVQDLTTGQGVHAGRFLRGLTTGQVEYLQIGGRLACRGRPPVVPGARSPGLLGRISA
ncbi:MAG: serine hydrolase domain-containing protein [Pseudonocardiaceae bacterium]